jgi:spore cortex biosynthesis protein YabQ
VSLQVQFLTLAAMAGSGAFLGVLYDVYSVLSGRLRPPRWLVPLMDFAYWIAATGLVFWALLASNNGQVRVYVFAALIFGVWLYFRMASAWTIRIVNLCIRIVQRLYAAVLTLIDWLIIKPAVLLYRLVVFILGFLAAASVFLFRFMVKCTYPFQLLGKWMWRPIASRWKTPQWWKRIIGYFRKK